MVIDEEKLKEQEIKIIRNTKPLDWSDILNKTSNQ